MDKPKMLFYITTYNQDKYLEGCLNSILAQTNPSWACVIIDDCSIDDTHDISKEFTAKDKRFRYLRPGKEMGMPAKCLNLAFKLGIEAEFETKIDGDNEVFPNWIDVMARDGVVTYSSYTILREINGEWRRYDNDFPAPEFNPKRLFAQYYLGPSFCWPQSCRLEWLPLSGMRGEIEETWVEDWNAALLCHETGIKLVPVQDNAFLYREYKGNATSRLLDTHEHREAMCQMIRDMAVKRGAR